MIKSTVCQLSFILLICLARLNSINGQEEDDVYTIGVGIADVTGPVAEVSISCGRSESQFETFRFESCDSCG